MFKLRYQKKRLFIAQFPTVGCQKNRLNVKEITIKIYPLHNPPYFCRFIQNLKLSKKKWIY